MKNIYANRMVKPPHRLPNSYNGTPTPPVKQRRPSLSDGITPRERAKLMEERRREDLRKQREMKEVSIISSLDITRTAKFFGMINKPYHICFVKVQMGLVYFLEKQHNRI